MILQHLFFVFSICFLTVFLEGCSSSGSGLPSTNSRRQMDYDWRDYGEGRPVRSAGEQAFSASDDFSLPLPDKPSQVVELEELDHDSPVPVVKGPWQSPSFNRESTIVVPEYREPVSEINPPEQAPESNLSFPDRNPDKSKLNNTQIQILLQKLGYYQGKIDGVIGSKSKNAIREFQSDAGLKVDGIAGPNTQTALLRKIESRL